jgi:GxxExxY protein
MKETPMKVMLKHSEITDKILHVFFKVVYAQLGYGFLEKVYETALVIALREIGLHVESQVKIHVYFQGQIIGEYFADLVVENKIIIEIKAIKQILKEHEAQLLNYLRATPYEVGLLLNFGPEPDFRRSVYDNTKKSITWEK